MNQNDFIYFQSVPGKLVTRFGTRSLIGAEIEREETETSKGRFPQTKTNIVWSEELVAIPKTEYDRWRREYTRCLREGSLIKVDPAAPQKNSKNKDK